MKKSKVISKIVMILIIMNLVVGICPVNTKAATKPKGPGSETFHFYPRDKDRTKIIYCYLNELDYVHWVDSNGVGHDAEFDNIKVSNKKVVSDIKFDGSFVKYTLKNTGKSTISFRARVGENTYYNYKYTIQVYKYQCPVKSFKINGKQHIKKMKNGDAECYRIKKGKKKFDFKMNKNWTVKSIKLYTADLKVKKLKNKKKFTLKMNFSDYIEIKCKYKKTKRYSTVTIVADK